MLMQHKKTRTQRPHLLFVYGRTSGLSRKIEGYVAQVLQHRHNHDTFRFTRICAEDQPELVEQLGVSALPAILVLERNKVQARLVAPKTRYAIVEALEPWLT